MFRAGRWKSDKNRVKAVFKLQFYVTQLPQLNVDGLVVCVVPADGGKATVRTDKAVVQDGSCRWENPVHETVKFAHDPKSEKINQKLYHFIVSSTGSVKAGVVGEASVDFAAYTDAIKASSLSLPLKNSKAILHVSLQRQHANAVPQRDAVECDNAEIASQNSLRAHLSTGDSVAIDKNDTLEDESMSQAAQNVELRRRASIESESTMSSSESFSGLDTPRENGIKATSNHQENPSLLTFLSHSMLVKPTSNGCEDPQISESDWSNGSDLGRKSIDISTNSSQDAVQRKYPLHPSDPEIEKLRSDVVSLTRQVDLSELELQTLRKQIVKETKRGQDLSKEVALLKEERDLLKNECEKLQAFEKRLEAAKTKSKRFDGGGDPWVILEEIRQELSYEKDLNSNLRLQLQKTQESNNELLLAVQDLDAMLQKKNKEMENHSYKVEPESRRSSPRSETDEDEDQKALEAIVKEHRDAKDAYLLEQKVMELYNEIDVYRRDKDELETQMEQLALDYEILKQQNHDVTYKLEQNQLQEQLKLQYECSSSLVNVTELENQVESLEKELEKRTKEFSESLDAIKGLETHVKSLEEEIERQAEVFAYDIEAVTRSKVEQEKRAIRAEGALRKTRRKNAHIAERLQDEFRKLSYQMSSAFEANEKMAAKALTESEGLRMQNRQVEDMLRKTERELESLREKYEAQIHELSEAVSQKTSQIEQIEGSLDTKSKELESEQNYGKEAHAVFSDEITRLKDEIAKLRTQSNSFREQAEQAEKLRVELHETKQLMKESEMLMQRGNMERKELENSISELKKQAEGYEADMRRMMSIKDEKEGELKGLKTEQEKLSDQYNDLKHSSMEDEMENERLRKQLFQLKSELKKKEEAISLSEKKLKDINGRVAVHNGFKTNARNKTSPNCNGTKEVANLKEKLKSLEAQIKLKEAALETSTNSFLEKEKDLKTKIEELEIQLEEVNEKTVRMSDIRCYEGRESRLSDSLNGSALAKSGMEESGSMLASTRSNAGSASLRQNEVEAEACRDEKTSNLLAELGWMKEQNQLMETELKDMQERYSEISLKFAEVEGERQKLVMTVRNLKNQRKG